MSSAVGRSDMLLNFPRSLIAAAVEAGEGSSSSANETVAFLFLFLFFFFFFAEVEVEAADEPAGFEKIGPEGTDGPDGACRASSPSMAAIMLSNELSEGSGLGAASAALVSGALLLELLP